MKYDRTKSVLKQYETTNKFDKSSMRLNINHPSVNLNLSTSATPFTSISLKNSQAKISNRRKKDNKSIELIYSKSQSRHNRNTSDTVSSDKKNKDFEGSSKTLKSTKQFMNYTMRIKALEKQNKDLSEAYGQMKTKYAKLLRDKAIESK